MSVGDHVLDAVLVVVTVAAYAAAAMALRRRWLPGWRGAPAALADAVVGLSLVVLVLELLGTVGLFRRGWIVGVSVAVGLVTWRLARARPAPATPPSEPTPTSSRASTAIGGTVVVVVVVQYVAATLAAYSRGMVQFDDLHYHLPQAARFVQTGWTTSLHHISPEFPISSYPENAELLHGAGMALTSNDVLSPLHSLAWLALLLLAAWCIGRPYGAAPAATAMAAAAMAVPQMSTFGAGSAHSDLPAIALLVASVALAIQPGGPARLTLSGAAAGLAMATKLTSIAPIGLMAVVLVAQARPAERRSTALRFAGAAAVTGSYWYVRNLLRTGSPMPSIDLKVFPKGEFTVADRPGSSVLHYMLEGSAWYDQLLDGLRDGIGRGWPLLAVAGALGIAGAAVRSDPARRLMAVVAVASIVTWFVTPTSALGRDGPELFAVNLRYAFGGVVLALVAIPLVRCLRTPVGQLASCALAAAIVVVSYAAPGALVGWPPGHRIEAVLVVAAAGGAVLLATVPRVRRPLRWAVLPALVVVAVAHPAQRWYLDRRYELFELTWLGEDDRIGVVGTNLQFQYYGADLSNHVQYVGDPGPHGEFHQIGTCAAWRRALAGGAYDYVAHWAQEGPVDAPNPPPPAWTASAPGAVLVHESEPGDFFQHSVYRLRGTPDATGCP